MDCRTVIVDIEKMTIADLTFYLTKELDLKLPQRIRNLVTNKLYNQEDMDSLLNTYEMFQEGGARCQLEAGRYAANNEIAVRVKIEPSEAQKAKYADLDIQDLYFKDTGTIESCMGEIFEAFEIPKTEQASFTLHRVDDFGVARFPIRKVKKSFEANQVQSGDLIILKSNLEVADVDKLNLHISITKTGLPDDCTHLG